MVTQAQYEKEQIKEKKRQVSMKKLIKEMNVLQFKCIMCNERFKTQEELSIHQYLFCTGGW